MPKIMHNGIAYGKGGKIIIHNGVAYGGSHVAKLIEKTIAVNGTYDASDDGVDGYSSVAVNVPVNMEIVPYGTLVPNTYIAAGYGEERTYNGCSATGYIEIDPDNYYYVFTGKLTAQQGDDWDATTNAYYDANKEYISGFSNNAGSGAPSDRDTYFHEFPSTAKYIRISQESSAFSDYKSFIARIRKSYINPNA